MEKFIPKIKSPLVYVTRDIERALGFTSDIPNFYIVTNNTSYAQSVAKERTQIVLIDSDELLDTKELLQHPKTQEFLYTLETPDILVFKQTKIIETICENLNVSLLNPSAKLAQTIERKISQHEWLGDLQHYLPKTTIKLCSELNDQDINSVIQFNTAHSGKGTIHLTNNEQIVELKKKFPKRPVRVSTFIKGSSYTVNAIIADTVYASTPSYQITGMKPFTNNPFATIGNDWSYADKSLTEEMKKNIDDMTIAIGNKMKKNGWKGAFGIDIIVEQDTNTVYLIEINARQTASVTYESHLQHGMSTFAGHVLGLLNEELPEPISQSVSGAQIVYRHPKTTIHTNDITASLKKQGLHIIQYDNTKEGSELLRIQSTKALITSTDTLSPTGEIIKETIEQYI